MSGPLSLRLCCMAAMAPALTEAAAQSRIKLTDTPPPDVSETPSPGVKVVTGAHKGNGVTHLENGNISLGDGAQKKTTVISLTSDLKGKAKRGLLKPIQGNSPNGRTSIYTINCASVNEDLKALGIIKNLPTFCRKISVSKQNSGTATLAAVEKKMNQPVNGNGPNGSGKRFIRPTSVLETRAVNGHSHTEVGTLLQNKTQYQGISLMKIEPLQQNSRSRGQLMCRTPTVTATQATTSVSITSSSVNDTRTASSVDDSAISSSAETSSSVTTKVESNSPVNPSTSEVSSTDLTEDAKRKEHLLEKRSQFLMRRLRRLQGKQLETHVKSQLRAFTEFQHQNLQTVATRAIRPNSNSSDFETGLFNSDDVKNLSTSALVSLVRKLQSSQIKMNLEQHLVNKKPKVETRGVLVMDRGNSAESSRVAGHLQTNLAHWGSAIDSDATESSSGGESCDEADDFLKERKPMPTPLYKRAEWKWAVDRAAIVARWTWLQAQVSDLEYRIRQQSEIHKTIRNSKGCVTLGETTVPEDLLTHLNQNRRVGPTGDSNLVPPNKKMEASPCNIATLLINVNRQASKLTQSLGNCYSPLQNSSVTNDILKNQSTSKALNGFVDSSHSNLPSSSQSHTSLSGSGDACKTRESATQGMSDGSSSVTVDFANSSSNASPDLSHPLDVTCQAARCRPLRTFRKRKLLRTAGLHQIYPKAARLSSVKCQCYPPTIPCVLCGGRYNNFQRLDAEGMPITEKCSILDPAYHPVLSFPQEIPLPVHFEALLKSGEWQSVKPPKATIRSVAAEKRRQKLITATLKDQARKNRKKSAAAVLLTSAKLRNKYDGKSPRGSSLPGTPKKKVTTETRLRRKEMKRRRAAQLAIAALKRNNRSMSCPTDGEHDGLDSRTPTPSPQLRDGTGALSSSCPSSTVKEMKDAAWKKKRESAYDINNIVIPYSMAASTRVEKLQYKEIQTPKWRDLTVEKECQEEMEVAKAEGEAEEEEEEEGDEDISDEAFLQRHLKCESQEKKRFMSFITYPPIRRSRVSRESESQTPDPLSPDNSMNEAQFSSALTQHEGYVGTPVSGLKEETRRRSGSTSSRRASLFGDMFGRDMMGDSMEGYETVQEPWQKREFPLKEEEYNEMKLEQAQSMPDLTRLYTRAKVVKMGQDSVCDFVTPFRSESPSAPGSPTASVSSASLQDDPNDPEWNEASDKPSQKTVVIKLAKR